MTPDPIDQWIAEAEARRKAATPGPWTVDGDIEDEPIVLSGEQYIAQTIYDRQSFTYRSDPKGHVKDAEFIAAARSDLPRALRLIRRYRNALTRIKDHDCTHMHEGCTCGMLDLPAVAAEALAYTGED